MRILLDENVPAVLRTELRDHNVTTVGRMRWSGFKNGELLRRATGRFDVFLTIDRSIQYQQNIPPTLGMITLQVPNNKPETVLSTVPAILQALETIQPGVNSHLTAVDGSSVCRR